MCFLLLESGLNDKLLAAVMIVLMSEQQAIRILSENNVNMTEIQEIQDAEQLCEEAMIDMEDQLQGRITPVISAQRLLSIMDESMKRIAKQKIMQYCQSELSAFQKLLSSSSTSNKEINHNPMQNSYLSQHICILQKCMNSIQHRDVDEEEEI